MNCSCIILIKDGYFICVNWFFDYSVFILCVFFGESKFKDNIDNKLNFKKIFVSLLLICFVDL